MGCDMSVCAMALLYAFVVECRDPKHNHKRVEAFFVIVLGSDSGLEAWNSGNFGRLGAKASP